MIRIQPTRSVPAMMLGYAPMRSGTYTMPKWFDLRAEPEAGSVTDLLRLAFYTAEGPVGLDFRVDQGWASLPAPVNQGSSIGAFAPACLPCSKQEFLEALRDEVDRQLAIIALEA